MIDALWVGLIVACLAGIITLVCLVHWLCRIASELLFFLKHQALLKRHAQDREHVQQMVQEFTRRDVGRGMPPREGQTP